jgi:SAM-dependent methyltransferase
MTDRELCRLAGGHGWSIEDHCSFADGVWAPRRVSSGTQSYPDDGHRAIAQIEDESYWFRHRNRAVARLVASTPRGSALWEVGAGTGVVAAHLARSGIGVVAVEPGPEGARIAADRGVPTVICGTIEELGLPDASVSAVGLFDVVEHLADPASLLDTVGQLLEPGGSLFVSVPAYQWLWSGADVEAGHFRRYTIPRLDGDVVPHGFHREMARYLFHSLVLPVAVGRTLRSALGRDDRRDRSDLSVTQSELRPSGKFVSAAIDAVLALEDAVDRVFPLPFGTSILARYERTP